MRDMNVPIANAHGLIIWWIKNMVFSTHQMEKILVVIIVTNVWPDATVNLGVATLNVAMTNHSSMDR